MGKLAALLQSINQAPAQQHPKLTGAKAKRDIQAGDTHVKQQKKARHQSGGYAIGKAAGSQGRHAPPPPPATSMEEEEPVLDSGAAYQTLMTMLTHGKGKAAEALRTRRREELGDSEEEEGSEDVSEDDDLPSVSDEGDSMDDDMEAQQEEEEEKEGDGVDGQPEGEHDDDGSSSDADHTAGANGHAHGSDEEQPGSTTRSHRRSNGGIITAGRRSPQPAEVSPQVDSWQLHLDTQITDTQVAQLAAAERVKWEDAEQPTQEAALFNGGQWQAAGGAVLPPAPASLSSHTVKERLISRWREVQKEEQQEAGKGKAGGKGSQGDFVSAEQRVMFAALQSYSNLVVGCRQYPGKLEAADPLLDAYLLHCLNHIAKTADRIKRNNDKLEAQKQTEGADPVEVPRDQGFTRPKVLILLPQRNLAFRLVLRLVKLAIKETRADSVTGKARFVEQFTDPEEVPEDELDAGAAARRAAKPPEWRALLGTGNTDDHFRLGIKITRGAVRLFSDLLQSDIIVASPLALATKLAEDAKRREEHLARSSKAAGRAAAKAKAEGSQGDGAADFLSSIEILIMDRADVLGMQNWGHVESVVEALNQIPREQHGVDIMRVREWALSGWAQHYRQTVLLSSFLSPAMNSLMGGHLTANYRGKLRLQPRHQGVLQHVIPQVQQVFERFTARSPVDMAEARFTYFTSTVWPRLKESTAWTSGGILVFIPSYFDYVRVRNFFKVEDNDAFDSISEYTPPPDVTSARNRFYQKRMKLLLYTERAHFYHRHRIRGVRDIVFYAPPDHAAYYTELVNLLESDGRKGGSGAGNAHGTVSLVYCKWDVLALERLVGASRAAKMIKGDTSTFMFC